MDKLVFACMVLPGRTDRQVLMLARSIRRFAGGLAGSPIWVLLPEPRTDLAAPLGQALPDLGVRLIPFAVSEDALAFPFAAKVFAAGAAELLAGEQGELLAWMDADSLVLNEPRPLLLPGDKWLGYRPVDHTLIGSRWHEPPDAFWELIYQHCGVPDDAVFPMTTSVDEIVIRPYFNAGLLAVRPRQGLLRAWREQFERLYRLECWRPFFEQSALYRIFLHQAILAGTILAACARQAMQEFPPAVNYPLHMHQDYPPARRPAAVEALISARYDWLAEDESQWDGLPVGASLRTWLGRQTAPGAGPKR